MINNIKLFEFSLDNPEEIIDKFYVKSGSLIISENPENPTFVMQNNLDLLECISSYGFARKNRNRAMMRTAIDKILKIIKSKNINYSEFISFWAVVDISYSLFKKMNDLEQRKILEEVVGKYIELRHSIFSRYGYSPTTLQVGKDAKAHKESGNLGIYKVAHMLDEAGFKKSNADSIAGFTSAGTKKYIESDKKGKKLFKDLLRHYGIRFFWSSGKEEKMPDFLIRRGREIFIVEHKHMKEAGGGQDKQINEIISLIGFSEKNARVHYVAFLDGIYFNLFSNKKYLNRGKVLNQLTNIQAGLKKNAQNYFVNTAGFKKLLANLG